jgi:uncharacterized protein YndB with AHSA1/START domain
VSCPKEGDAVTNESILISEVIPATPQRIFSAWMDSAEHSAFTGDEAIVVPEVGGEHQSAGGYIKGRTLELNEGSRIVQSWRTTEFPAESPDSRVEITLEPTLGGTLVTLLHTDIPVGQGDRYRQGWNEYYLSRLKTYFADSEPTLETRAEPGAEIGVDDVDVESEIVELDPSTVSEAPTRVMSQSARFKKPAMAAAKSPAMAAKAKAPVKMVAKAAAKAAKKPAIKAKAPATKAAAAKAASRKPARVAIAVKSTKKVAAKAKRGKAVSMKAAARKPAKSAAKAARKTATKTTRKTATKAGRTKAGRTKAGKKKGASSARSRRR